MHSLMKHSLFVHFASAFFFQLFHPHDVLSLSMTAFLLPSVYIEVIFHTHTHFFFTLLCCLVVFGQSFGLLSLLQCLVFIFVSLLLSLSVNTTDELYLLYSPDMNFDYFWKWSAFEDYLLFCFGFTVLCAVVTLLLLDSPLFVETLGSLAVTFEAMLGLPQLLQNLQNHSTKGMRYCTLQGHIEPSRNSLSCLH